MLFLYPTPAYPRTVSESIIKILYYLTNLAHLSCLVILVTEYILRLNVSVTNFYSNKDLIVAPGIVNVMQDCVYTDVITLQSTHVTVELSIGSVPYALMTTIQYLNGLFVLQFLLLVNNLVSFVNFTSGNRHLRLCGVHIPFYHINVVFTYLYSIGIIVMTWCFDPNRRFFARALDYCAEQMRHKNPQAYIDSEFSNGTIFQISVYWPFIATCFGLFVYLISAIILCWNSSDKANLLLSEADAPWESRGFRCQVSKPLLRLHTTQRKAIIDDARQAIFDGQKVRIVRSYQLMTEEDFNALVQAMREQAAMLIKESQFEQLRANFADHESQIDEQGFLWRHTLPSAPPSPQMGDEFQDVDFDAYFDHSDHDAQTLSTRNEPKYTHHGSNDHNTHAPHHRMPMMRESALGVPSSIDEASGSTIDAEHAIQAQKRDYANELAPDPSTLSHVHARRMNGGSNSNSSNYNAANKNGSNRSAASNLQEKMGEVDEMDAETKRRRQQSVGAARGELEEDEEVRQHAQGLNSSSPLPSHRNNNSNRDDHGYSHPRHRSSLHRRRRSDQSLRVPPSASRHGERGNGSLSEQTKHSSSSLSTSRRARQGESDERHAHRSRGASETMRRWSPSSAEDGMHTRVTKSPMVLPQSSADWPSNNNNNTNGRTDRHDRSTVNDNNGGSNNRDQRYIVPSPSGEEIHTQYRERAPPESLDMASVEDHSRPDYLDVRQNGRRERELEGRRPRRRESNNSKTNNSRNRTNRSINDDNSSSASHLSRRNRSAQQTHHQRHSTHEDYNVEADELSELYGE